MLFVFCNAVCIFDTNSGMVFHNWGATVENARPPYGLDFMAGVDNSERDDDLSALDGWYVLIRGSRYPADCPVWCLVRWSPSARISSKSFLPLHISSYNVDHSKGKWNSLDICCYITYLFINILWVKTEPRSVNNSSLW